MGDTFTPQAGVNYSTLSGPNAGTTGSGSTFIPQSGVNYTTLGGPNAGTTGSGNTFIPQPGTSYSSKQQQSSGGGNTGGSMSQDQKNALFHQQTGGNIAPAGWNPGGSNNPASNLPNLDSLYAPIFANYDQMKGQIEGTQGQYQQDLQNSYNQNLSLIPGYQKAQSGQIDLNELSLQNQIQNANDTAARNYQWANQSAGNQYGYNGAFLGANSLAQTEMQRELGLVGQEGVQGEGQIGQQRSDLSNWADQQKINLSNQYMGAKDNLNQYFQQQLFALMNDRNATEAQKAAGKVQLLQDVMNQNNAIQQQAVNFQQQMALYNAQMGQTANTGYTMPNALQQAMQQTQNTIQNGVNPANQTFGALTGQNPANAPIWQAPSQNQNNDYLNSILSYSGVANPGQQPQTNAQAGSLNTPGFQNQQNLSLA